MVGTPLKSSQIRKKGGKNKMSETQQQLEVCSFVVSYMNTHEKWQGSASELAKVLQLDITPRSLSVELKKQNDELENSGISITWARKRNKRVISIANSTVVSQNEVSLRHIEETTPRNNGFASHIEKQRVVFPFEWLYGLVEALSEEEKIEVNCIRYIGRKPYQKPCSLCGEEGVSAFRKTSDCSSSLICESCAVRYALSAIKLQEEHGVGGDLM